MEKTSDYIIKTIAPIFNRKGYVGTSLSDLTKATNLTKGALYCNFKNKEELALASFRWNVRNVVFPLQNLLAKASGSIEKLFTITEYYRNYYEVMMEIGGCPILKVNSDTKDNNEALYNLARQIARRMLDDLEEIILVGKENNEIAENIDAGEYARNIYSMIEGSAFMAATHENPTFISDMMNHIDILIRDKISI